MHSQGGALHGGQEGVFFLNLVERKILGDAGCFWSGKEIPGSCFEDASFCLTYVAGSRRKLGNGSAER